jgi:uncharacterized membrane protein
MAIGPVQLLVLGFPSTEATGEIAAEFQRLRDLDLIRVVDALLVMKDEDGNAVAAQTSQLTADEQVEFGAVVGALIGLGIGGEEGMEEGAEAGAEAAAEGGFEVFDEQEAWDVIEDIPNGTSAALILLEHRWAIRLRDAVARAGGFPISDGFIHAEDLVAVGLATAGEAAELESSGSSS